MDQEIKVHSVSDYKRIHFLGVSWFFFCLVYLLVVTLHAVGFDFWIIFSISGYSLPVVMFLLLVYLFAVYKGVVRNLNSIEHPLTTSPYYVVFYDISPFLGAIAGIIISPTAENMPLSIVTAAAQGTLTFTFLTWIIMDSSVDLVEVSFPQSRLHRLKRLEESRAQKREEAASREQLLDRVVKQEEQRHSQWAHFFQPFAKEVADLLCDPSANVQPAQHRIIELGALAWHTGEQLCMKFFHKAILEELKDRPQRPSVDFVTLYWDGIGTWRKPSTLQQMYI